MTHERIGAALAIAGRHHQLIRQQELDRCGITRHGTGRLVKAGVFERLRSPGILRVAGTEPTWHQALLAAVWAAGVGAVASHRSAGAVWLLDAIEGRALEISVPSSTGTRLRNVTVHYRRSLGLDAATEADGIPVTEPTRTVADLAGVVDADVLEAAFESALRQGLTSLPRARTILDRLEKEGRRGLAPFRRMLEHREELTGITDSYFEIRLIQVLRSGGLPEPTRQLDLHDDKGFIGRFDCTYPDAMMAIEADSERWHLDLKRFHRDRTKRTRAEAIGWRVPTFTYAHVSRQPTFVIDTIRTMLDRSDWSWRPADEPSARDRIA